MWISLPSAQKNPLSDACIGQHIWPAAAASRGRVQGNAVSHLRWCTRAGNWELVVLPTQPGLSAHPPKLPCPEPTRRTGTSTGDRKGWSKLPRLLISLNYQLRSSKRRFAWNSWPLLTFLFVQKWAVFAMSQHVLCVLILHLQKNPSAKGRAGNAEWAPLSRRRYILNK